MKIQLLPLTVIAVVLCGSYAPAQDKAATEAGAAAAPDDAARKERFEKFEKQMSGVKLTGSFTIAGRPQAGLSSEEYEISSVKKMPGGDLWLFSARIKYGKYDVTLPLPIEVKWAGDTPVITLDKVTIPTLGTFSSRVVIDGDKYAGTWTHDAVGGHMFGMIERVKEAGGDDQ